MDYYALGRDGWLSDGLYRNLEMMAEYGKKKGHRIAVTLLSNRMDTGYNPKTGRGRVIYREPNYEDMRWQVYSSLAFGVKEIGYFTFWQHYSESTNEMFAKAMINYDSSEEKGYRVTEIYDAVKKVNDEILAIDHIFGRFEWQGCKTVKTSRAKNIRLVKGDYSDGLIGSLTATRDLLVGCFENPEDIRKGYWIVNAHNPYFFEENDVTVQFDSADKVVYYRKGKEYIKTLDNHTFSIRLGVGEGVFVIPYNE